jgi:spore coat protein A
MREHDDSTGLSRRQILGIGGSLGVIAAAGLSTAAALGNRSLATGAELVSAIPLPAPFHVPLPIPPVLRPVDVTGGVDRYEITQREVRAEILPGITSRL